MVTTGNGTVLSDTYNESRVAALDMPLNAIYMPNAPNLSAMGPLIRENKLSFLWSWTDYERPLFWRGDGVPPEVLEKIRTSFPTVPVQVCHDVPCLEGSDVPCLEGSPSGTNVVKCLQDEWLPDEPLLANSSRRKGALISLTPNLKRRAGLGVAFVVIFATAFYLCLWPVAVGDLPFAGAKVVQRR